MKKALTVLLSIVAMGLTTPAMSQTCAQNCPAPELQFVPGERINVQIVNRTRSAIDIEKVQGTKPTPLAPGQILKFERRASTEPNLSVVWDATAFPLKAVLSKPNKNTLRIELFGGAQVPGDRSVYIRNDGRVEVL